MHESPKSLDGSLPELTTSARTELESAWAREVQTAAKSRPRLATSLTTLLGGWQATLRPLYAQEHRRSANATSVHQDRRSLAMDISADTYSDLMNAYHHFLQMCVGHVVGMDHALPALPEERQSARRLERAFPALAADCWLGDEMLMRRAIRQTLSHNNGFDHPRLDRWRDRLRIDKGRLRIGPSDVFALYQGLKKNVERLIQGVVLKPLPV